MHHGGGGVAVCVPVRCPCCRVPSLVHSQRPNCHTQCDCEMMLRSVTDTVASTHSGRVGGRTHLCGSRVKCDCGRPEADLRAEMHA